MFLRILFGWVVAVLPLSAVPDGAFGMTIAFSDFAARAAVYWGCGEAGALKPIRRLPAPLHKNPKISNPLQAAFLGNGSAGSGVGFLGGSFPGLILSFEGLLLARLRKGILWGLWAGILCWSRRIP